MWGMIRRNFKNIDCDTFPLLFKSLVRPHLEYANVTWSPYAKGLINDIESVQRSATKQIPGFKDIPYPIRLQILQLPTLKHRRRRGDLIEFYKMMTKVYDEEVLPEIIRLPSENHTRGHEYRVVRPISHTNKGHNRFTSRVVNDWNKLPEHVVNATTVNSFKNRIDQYFENDPSVYNHEL